MITRETVRRWMRIGTYAFAVIALVFVGLVLAFDVETPPGWQSIGVWVFVGLFYLYDLGAISVSNGTLYGRAGADDRERGKKLAVLHTTLFYVGALVCFRFAGQESGPSFEGAGFGWYAGGLLLFLTAGITHDRYGMRTMHGGDERDDDDDG